MQPGATNISVEFDVPRHDCVLKAPKVIPCLFSGEKFVMYGIFKSSKTSDILQGKATLKYTICGKQTKAEVPFTAIEQVPVVPVVHHLAAKQRLLELKESGGRQEMVTLSIESSVQCPQTAFLAVDEKNQLPISAPMKTYDLYSMEPEFNDMLSGAMALGYSRCDSLYSSDENGCEKDNFFCLSEDKGMNSQLLPACNSAVLLDNIEPISSTSSANYASSAAKPSLSTLVALQLANGSWSLTGPLCSELGKELKVVEDNCPSGCPSAVWATALALSSLKLTYSSQQDEWELVAKKAEAWLKKQSLPPNLTLQNLHSKAEKFI